MTLATRVFGEGGLLERTHPGFEQRPGQVRMSEAVAGAIEAGHHLIMEAPTGTGKTFAYLVPAIDSGRRVVVSTGTKNLQEQLFHRDIPLLEKVLDRPISAAFMKGRDNYLCIRRLKETMAQPALEDLSERGFMDDISSWAARTGTGDRGELEDLPDSFRLWDRLNARADICTGQRCEEYEACFLTRMRRTAAESQVVVVNHHLLLADLILKEHSFGQVIPDYSVLVLDEAHAVEEIATTHLGRSLSSRQVSELADDLERASAGPGLRRRAGALREAGKGFFGLMPPAAGGQGDAGRFPLEPWRRDDEWLAAGSRLKESLGACGSALRESIDEPEQDMAQLGLRAAEQAAALDLLLGPGGGEPSAYGPMVTWGEVRGRGIALRAAPIDVSSPLRSMLFERVPTVILTSATLAIGGSFSFVRTRLGIDEAGELALESPFDLASQAILLVPRDFPEPGHPDFIERLCRWVRELLDVTAGRAFLLFTSFNHLRRVRGALEGTVPYPLLSQGEASRHALLERFRRTPNAVLLATASFWHGVDVQGDALSLVVIDKLPFDVPGDPIVSARIAAIRDRGGEPFREYQVPAAAIDLKQGLGRLIRSRRDRGILAVMDSRLLTRSYGRIFLESLPPYPMVHDLTAARAFFSSGN